jgi:lysozyme
MKRVLGYLAAVALAVGGVSYVSLSGLTAIDKHEGYRLVAYPDPATKAAPWTICRGHTKGVYRGMRATPEQCDRWFAEDVYEAETCVQRATRVSLRQGEYDARVSFVFNVGCRNYQTSTMLRLTNQGQWRAACNQFPKWVYANKMKMDGLVTRRWEEQAMCLKEGPYVYHR